MLRAEPTEDLLDGYLEMCHEYQAEGETDYATIRTFEDAQARLERERCFAAGLVPSGSVRNFAYWFIDDARDRILGTGRIRPVLNERFLRVGGHIGFDVRPSERRKGLGTAILREMLGVAREFGLVRVLVTVASGNTGSVLAIENNRGVFESGVPDGADGIILRYWISIEPSLRP
ncbi:MAG TPA: GNAT family N-acetyltransferase [Rectinemataceae bacterium]|nr:GNAT family N-acetyltransferase [Rectinemataceae bacterium]